MYTTQPPTKLEDSRLGERYTHPAFGVVQVSQWQAGTEFYHTGSSVGHSTGFTIAISEAEVYNSFGTERVSPQKRILEISMTPLQFVEIMSSVGKGAGVPCTLSWTRESGSIPGITAPKTDIQNARDHVEKNAKQTLDGLKKALADLKELDTGAAISKTKYREALRSMEIMVQNFASNISFPVECAAEAAERTSSEIVRNAEVKVSAMLRELGTEALGKMLVDGSVDQTKILEG